MPRGNITIADFSGGGRKTTTAALWQYDYGQILQFSGIEGLPSAYEVHFSNDRVAGEAKTQIGNEYGVTIPDEYFLSGKPIFAWIFLHAGANDGETEYQVTIPINKCSRPVDQPPTPAEQSVVTQAISALNVAVEKTESNVAHYPKIENGYWYVWDAINEDWVNTGVRAEGEGTGIESVELTKDYRLKIYFTDGTSYITPIPIRGEPGQDGDSPTASVQQTDTGATIYVTDKTGTTTATIDDGEDGYSPTVTVADITGGHRVTITDETGAHTFDVMDGDGGGSAVRDVQVAGTSVVSAGVANVPMASPNTPGVVVSGTVSVTGTTPTINAVPGVRYMCGEVSTLDITLPASGIVDVTFESGSTPTVLTITPPTGVTLKWANGFDPTALEANTSYELRVIDGEFGVAVAYGSGNSNIDNGWTYIRDVSLDPNNQTPNAVYGVDENNHIGYVTINEDADGNSFSYKYVMVVGVVSTYLTSGSLYVHPTPMNNLSKCQISAWNVIDKADTMYSVCMWNEKFYGGKIISHCIAGRQYADQKFRFGGVIMGDMTSMAGSPMLAFLNETIFNSITIGDVNYKIIDGTVSVFGRN